MPSIAVNFAGNKVALIVRGKISNTHSPGKMAQHADCVRSDGSPIGFFGEGGGGSGYMSSAVLIGIKGEVYDLDAFNIKRPFYVDATLARTYKVISTALVITVTPEEAKEFDSYWAKLKADPSTFSLIGRNCSTRASGAFRFAKILSGGIPGLDTPDNLYRQLRAERPDRCTDYSGYIGFETAGNGMSMRVDDPNDGA